MKMVGGITVILAFLLVAVYEFIDKENKRKYIFVNNANIDWKLL